MNKEYKVGPIKVRIDGGEYWFQQDEDGGGPISPLEHCDENGELVFPNMFSSETFAHVRPDRHIKRFGKDLGLIDDLLKDHLIK